MAIFYYKTGEEVNFLDKMYPPGGVSPKNCLTPPRPTPFTRCRNLQVTAKTFPGHTPSTAGTFWKKFRKNSGKTPETLSELFLEFQSRVRLGSPKPYNSRHLRLPEHFQNCLPPSTAGGASFFRSGSGEGLSELLSWNSQQYWGYF